MKKFSIVGVLMAASLISVAHADNKPWAGLYAGVSAGLMLNHAALASSQAGFNSPTGTCNANANFSNGALGAQLGYLYQAANFIVSGVEVNATINGDQQNTSNCNSPFNAGVYDRFTFRNQMQVSVKGRVGRLLPAHENLLPYLTAGVSAARLGLTYKNEANDYYANTATSLGGLIGGGIEWAFKDHWSLRAEYNFVDYGNVIRLAVPVVYGLNDPNGSANINVYSNDVFIALNYWV